MCQFSQHSLLSYLSTYQQLHQRHIDDMAVEIAKFHMSIEKATTDSTFGTPEDIHYWSTDNFEQIEANTEAKGDLLILDKIKAWSKAEYSKKNAQFIQRENHGFVRECHGDMHLDNMVLINGKVTIFDGIDFNKHLRWIDIMSEVAFVAMDLRNRGYPEFANRFINLYLQHIGDYNGLSVLNYYLVYRAIVRAKIAALRISQKHLSKAEEKKLQKEFKSYIELCSCYILKLDVALIITHGLSGSGKSTYTESLFESIGAIRIRSDVERKRLRGYEASEHTHSPINEGIYTEQSSLATYTRLVDLSKSILNSGYPVIVDACFLQRKQRDEFHMLASDLQKPFIILAFQATEEILKERIITRAKNKCDSSEANLEVLNFQLNNYELLNDGEKINTIIINTEEDIQISEVVKSIVNRM